MELEQILAPMDPGKFIDEYFGQKPLYIKGTPMKFRTLFNRQRFESACNVAAQLTPSSTFRLSALVENFDGTLSRTEPITPDQITSVFDAGLSICVNDISLGDEELAAVCALVKRRINFAGWVRCNSYLSPDGSGADTHFDTSISTTLQIEGNKRWRYAEKPAIGWPRSNAQLGGAARRKGSLPWVVYQPWEQLGPVHQSQFNEVVLEPGDVLCLPAGTWHSAKAIGHSLALNMAFAPATGFTVLMHILEPLLEQNEAWRGGPPATYAPEPNAEQFPANVRQYIAARLYEVCETLSAVDLDSEFVRRVWSELVEAPE